MAPVPAAPFALARPDAVRFLQLTTFGGSRSDVDDLVATGTDAWFDAQLAEPSTGSHLQRRIDGIGMSNSIWESYLSHTDQLRKRWSYALSQIFVVSDNDLSSYEVASYADLLETHCFGTFRNLLERVTRSVAMGRYLTYRRNRKEDDRIGRVPDENYAREVMQLFSIGLWELDPDGTQRTDGSGQPISTYGQDDILGLARVFTGFDSPSIDDDLSRYALPMISDGEFADRYHERGEKRFLGVVVPASETRTLDESLAIALDTLDAHPNTAPFICRQLIQRLVTSNPSPAYVQRVASVFDDDGSAEHVRGNLAAVLRAIVYDDEAWPASPGASYGKLREPVLRFTTMTRALDVSATAQPWPVPSLAESARELGQQPYESPSVFNFYRPGYVPPQSSIGDAGLVAPEMQLANETTAIGWINYLLRFIHRPPAWTINRDQPDEYRTSIEFDLDDLVALIAFKSIDDSQAGALVDAIAERVCPRGLGAAVRDIAVRRVREVYDDRYDPDATEEYQINRRNNVHHDRVVAAVMMIAASTDYLHER